MTAPIAADLDALEALLAGAHPAPWEAQRPAWPKIVSADGQNVAVLGPPEASEMYGSSAALIAALRNAAPELLRLARLGAEAEFGRAAFAGRPADEAELRRLYDEGSALGIDHVGGCRAVADAAVNAVLRALAESLRLHNDVYFKAVAERDAARREQQTLAAHQRDAEKAHAETRARAEAAEAEVAKLRRRLWPNDEGGA